MVGRLVLFALVDVLLILARPLAGQVAGPPMQLTRELRIDAAGENLSDISFIAPFRDGAVAVAQSPDGKLLYFSADGRRIGSFGRRGAGPGEFGMVGPYGWVGDTIWIGDANLHRVTVISPDRKLLRIVPWPHSSLVSDPTAPVDAVPTYTNARILGILPDSDLLIAGSVLGVSQAPRWSVLLRDASGLIVRATPNGSPRKLVATIPHPLAAGCAINVAGERMFVPECAEPFWAVADDATRVVVVYPDVANPRAGAIVATMVAASGDTLYRRRVPIPLVPISARQADSIRQRVSARSSSPARARAWLSAKLPAVFRPVKPSLFIGRDGALWVEIRSPGQDHFWVILSSDGKSWRHISVPLNTRLMAADAERVWGTEADEDGLESVVRYRYR